MLSTAIWVVIALSFLAVILNSLNGGLVISTATLVGTLALAYRRGWRP